MSGKKVTSRRDQLRRAAIIHQAKMSRQGGRGDGAKRPRESEDGFDFEMYSVDNIPPGQLFSGGGGGAGDGDHNYAASDEMDAGPSQQPGSSGGQPGELGSSSARASGGGGAASGGGPLNKVSPAMPATVSRPTLLLPGMRSSAASSFLITAVARVKEPCKLTFSYPVSVVEGVNQSGKSTYIVSNQIVNMTQGNGVWNLRDIYGEVLSKLAYEKIGLLQKMKLTCKIKPYSHMTAYQAYVDIIFRHMENLVVYSWIATHRGLRRDQDPRQRISFPMNVLYLNYPLTSAEMLEDADYSPNLLCEEEKLE